LEVGSQHIIQPASTHSFFPRTQYPKKVSIPVELLAGWGLQGASPAQVDVLTLLRDAKLMHIKREVLERGIGLERK
jgi:hypothetical protein